MWGTSLPTARNVGSSARLTVRSPMSATSTPLWTTVMFAAGMPSDTSARAVESETATTDRLRYKRGITFVSIVEPTSETNGENHSRHMPKWMWLTRATVGA